MAATTAMLTALMCACSGTGRDADPTPQATPAAGRIEHPEGEDELILRVTVGGGFVPVESNLTELPVFSLFGDGSLVVPGPQIAIFPGPALPNVQARTVSEEGVQAILARAREAGLEGADRHLPMERIADAPTTTFTVTAGGRTHTTSAYALGIEAGPEGENEEPQERRQLKELRDDLTGLEQWLPSGEVGPERPYDFSRLRVFVMEGTSGGTGGEVLEQAEVPWPLDESPLAEFGEPYGQIAYRCGVVEGEGLDEVLRAARQANQLTPWSSEGVIYSLLFRPLLPDESGCSEPARHTRTLGRSPGA